MPDKVIIEGTGLYAGSYDIDIDGQPLTNWDLHVIKKVSGVRAGELVEAFEAGDTDLIVALAVIALYRNGAADRKEAVRVGDYLMQQEMGSVKFTAGEPVDAEPEAEAQGPLDSTQKTSPDVPERESSASEPSGSTLNGDTADPGTTPTRSGTRSSVTGSPV